MNVDNRTMFIFTAGNNKNASQWVPPLVVAKHSFEVIQVGRTVTLNVIKLYSFECY